MLQRPTLLVVDDEPLLRDLLQRVLGSKYDLLLASNGREAIALFVQERHRIAIVLTDLNMPKGNGSYFLAWLAEQPNPAPVLVVSSDTDARVLHGQFATRLQLAYLRKPYRLEALEECVVQLLYLGLKSPDIEL